MTYDLHIHSCLSPCAEDEMTPSAIAGFARLNGIDLIAVTDHNSARNLPAAQAACAAYGVQMLPGIEVNTAEEIHLLCYFPTVAAALRMDEAIYQSLPTLPYDRTIWGRQLVMDENDTVTAEPDKLLTLACGLDLYAATALCRDLGGVAVPAHVDRDSYSLLSVLGFAPEDLPFPAFEVRRPEHTLAGLLAAGRMPQGREILTSSDAHSLLDISEHPRVLDENSCLARLISGGL